MKSIAFIGLASLLGACCVDASAISFADSQPPAPHTVEKTLTIVAKKPDGSTIAGLSFGTMDHIGSDNAALKWSAISDAQGVATTTVRVDSRATSLAIGPRGASLYPDVPTANPRQEFRSRVAALSQTMALPSEIRARIPVSGNNIYISFQAVPGTTLNGRLVVQGAGTPITNAVAWIEGYFADCDAGLADGSISLVGVPTNLPVWLAAGWGDRTVYRQATITGGPYSLGDWQLGSADLTCPVTVTVPVAAGTPESKTPVCVSFVRADGQDVLSFELRRQRLGANASNPDALIGSSSQSVDLVPRLAPGTYYVFPDTWSDTEVHRAFIRRLRIGDTPPTSIPKFVATGGQSVSGTIDFAATQAAVVSWIRPYVEANGQSGNPPAP